MHPPARCPSRPWPSGWRVDWVAETGSTNADLLAAGQAGAPGRTVLAADLQTAGRGRLDRRWRAPAGTNLLVSLLLRDGPEHPHQVVQRVALAARDAVAAVAGVDAALKWPNDLLVGRAKLAGVLAQAGSSAGGAFVVVGIGINVGWAPDGAARLGEGVAPAEVLASMLVAFDLLPADVTPAYRQHLDTLGRRVRVELPGGRAVVGCAVDVEADGRLVVLDDRGTSHRIDTGDVIHLRRAD